MENILNALRIILEPFTKTVKAPSNEDMGRIVGYGRTMDGNLYPIYENKASPAATVAPTVAPTAAPAPSATPSIEQIARQMTMDYSPYIADQGKIDTHFPQGLPQPTLEQKIMMLMVSPNDATRSAILKLGETGMNKFNGTGPFNYVGDNSYNNNGTIDRGPNQINSGTFNWMWNQQGNKKGTYPYRDTMQKHGVSSFEDMKDPMKNERVMDLIRGVQGYGKSDKSGGGWYGWADKGFDLNR